MELTINKTGEYILSLNGKEGSEILVPSKTVYILSIQNIYTIRQIPLDSAMKPSKE